MSKKENILCTLIIFYWNETKMSLLKYCLSQGWATSVLECSGVQLQPWSNIMRVEQAQCLQDYWVFSFRVVATLCMTAALQDRRCPSLPYPMGWHACTVCYMSLRWIADSWVRHDLLHQRREQELKACIWYHTPLSVWAGMLETKHLSFSLVIIRTGENEQTYCIILSFFVTEMVYLIIEINFYFILFVFI